MKGRDYWSPFLIILTILKILKNLIVDHFWEWLDFLFKIENHNKLNFKINFCRVTWRERRRLLITSSFLDSRLLLLRHHLSFCTNFLKIYFPKDKMYFFRNYWLTYIWITYFNKIFSNCFEKREKTFFWVKWLHFKCLRIVLSELYS